MVIPHLWCFWRKCIQEMCNSNWESEVSLHPVSSGFGCLIGVMLVGEIVDILITVGKKIQRRVLLALCLETYQQKASSELWLLDQSLVLVSVRCSHRHCALQVGRTGCWVACFCFLKTKCNVWSNTQQWLLVFSNNGGRKCIEIQYRVGLHKDLKSVTWEYSLDVGFQIRHSHQLHFFVYKFFYFIYSVIKLIQWKCV